MVKLHDHVELCAAYGWRSLDGGESKSSPSDSYCFMQAFPVQAGITVLQRRYTISVRQANSVINTHVGVRSTSDDSCIQFDMTSDDQDEQRNSHGRNDPYFQTGTD